MTTAVRIFELSLGQMLWSRRSVFLALVIGLLIVSQGRQERYLVPALLPALLTVAWAAHDQEDPRIGCTEAAHGPASNAYLRLSTVFHSYSRQGQGRGWLLQEGHASRRHRR